MRGEINENITGCRPAVAHICTKSVLMKRYILIIIGLSATFFSYGKKATKVNRPRLVVGIVVDQMRWDYLYRYYDHYGSGGFRRLMNDGFNCQNTMINYLPSYTAPGHTCIYTGSVPSIHGIAANDWYDATTGKTVYCTDDTEHAVVDGHTGGISMSPRNLKVTTITDELRLATNFRSRVYGVAIKDRGSILPAGHLANGAYWLDDSTGSFCSSTYYKNTSPEWLKAFNNRKVTDSLIAAGWQTLDDVNTGYAQSVSNGSKYGGKLKGEQNAGFPHSISTELKPAERYNAFKATPGGNYLTLLAAMACRDGEHLGEGDFTDFLAISLSSTDYAGHTFAPNSIEAEDMYRRLDGQLAMLLQYLDKTIGKGNYTVFLSADHGAAHNPQFLLDNNVPAGLLSKDYKAEVNTYLAGIYKQQGIIRYYTNYQLYVDDSVIRSTGLDRNKVRESIIDQLNTMPELAYAVDMENMDRTAVPEPLRTMLINGYSRGRSGSIALIPQPAWFEGHGKTGTTHGTWNPYDTHIPLLWYGWGIPTGETNTEVHMTDISATLAALLHIQMPNGCIGKPIIMR